MLASGPSCAVSLMFVSLHIAVLIADKDAWTAQGRGVCASLRAGAHAARAGVPRPRRRLPRRDAAAPGPRRCASHVHRACIIMRWVLHVVLSPLKTFSVRQQYQMKLPCFEPGRLILSDTCSLPGKGLLSHHSSLTFSLDLLRRNCSEGSLALVAPVQPHSKDNSSSGSSSMRGSGRSRVGRGSGSGSGRRRRGRGRSRAILATLQGTTRPWECGRAPPETRSR